MVFFSIYDEYRSYRGKTVSEQWRHQTLVDARRQYILLVYNIFVLSFFILKYCLSEYINTLDIVYEKKQSTMHDCVIQ